jgi:hypothetical protein
VSLEKWAEYGWLRAEPTSRDEIKSPLTSSAGILAPNIATIVRHSTSHIGALASYWERNLRISLFRVPARH